MLMRGHKLFDHLDGLIPIPSKTSVKTTSKYPVMPMFQQDQLIQNVILEIVDATIAVQLLLLRMPNESQTRILSFRNLLGHFSKESRPTADYLHQVRSLSDDLDTAGSPVSNEELVVKILTGLGSEF